MRHADTRKRSTKRFKLTGGLFIMNVQLKMSINSRLKATNKIVGQRKAFYRQGILRLLMVKMLFIFIF